MSSKSKSVTFNDEPQVIEYIKAKFNEREQLFNSRYEIGQMKQDYNTKINDLFKKALKDFQRKEYIQSITQLRGHMSSVEGSESDKDKIRKLFMDHINNQIENDIDNLLDRFYKSEHYSVFLIEKDNAGGSLRGSASEAWSKERLRMHEGKSKKSSKRKKSKRTRKYKK
jgi:hypothetical protein